MHSPAQIWIDYPGFTGEADWDIPRNWHKPTNYTYPATRLLTLQIILQTHNPTCGSRGRKSWSANKRTRHK
jgi:hypothetical protein